MGSGPWTRPESTRQPPSAVQGPSLWHAGSLPKASRGHETQHRCHCRQTVSWVGCFAECPPHTAHGLCARRRGPACALSLPGGSAHPGPGVRTWVTLPARDCPCSAPLLIPRQDHRGAQQRGRDRSRQPPLAFEEKSRASKLFTMPDLRYGGIETHREALKANTRMSGAQFWAGLGTRAFMPGSRSPRRLSHT